LHRLRPVSGATERVRIRKQRNLFINDLSSYKGLWHGVHHTRVRHDGNNFGRLSRHQYELAVSSSGGISGRFSDAVTAPEMEYRATGTILPGCIVLTSRSSSRPQLFATEVYFRPLELKRLEGIIAGYDYADKPFVAPIVLTRDRLSDEAAEEALNQARAEFFVDHVALPRSGA
jgi:hypothetical protein